jgi:ABC-type branched-subunit amino acid transport system substrate-binding protein
MGMIRHIILTIIIALGVVSATAQDQVIRHHVQSTETFYSLSVKYHVTIDQIKAANPGVTYPKTGDYLNIPVKSLDKPADKPNECDKLKKGRNQIYEVALMIPLYLEQTVDSGWAERIDASQAREFTPFRFIQFYQGFILAADSMKQQGMNIKIFVYDVDQQASKTKKALSDPEMKEMDLIVGPFLKNSFAEVAEFAKENQIPIVNPLSQRTDILIGNPFVFKLMPSPESQPETIGKLVKRDFSGYSVILYSASQYQNTEIVEEIREAVQNALEPGALPIKMEDYATDSIRGFLQYASATKPNLIIVYSEGEAFPMALLSKLNAVKSDHPVTVIGMPEWDKFSILESGYLLALNTHIFTGAYVDYDNEDVKGFVRRYRADYIDEPLDYAFGGFSAGYYFLQALYQYGRDFPGCLSSMDVHLPQNQFHFVKQQDGGYDNVYWNVMQYYDYHLVDRSITWK